MKRDMELVRLILLTIEGDDSEKTQLELSKYTDSQQKYHIILLIERGFLEGRIFRKIDQVTIDRLTWEGHDFLDDIRDDTLWNSLRDKFGNKLSEMSIHTLKAVASSLAIELTKSYAGLS